MGSSKSKQLSPAQEASAKVDKFLQDEAERNAKQSKILILGAGESGKSTILKQVKVIYKIPFQPVELAGIRQTIQFNCVQSMNILITALVDYSVPVDSKTSKLIKTFTTNHNKILTETSGELIAKLWKRDPIQKAWALRDQFWYLDAAEYYFANVERIADSQYEPTPEDIIMARVRTSGIVVTDFKEGDANYSIVDVGGQRNERRKWIHCFDDVKTVLFVVSLIGYNQVMYEDPDKLRLHEALTLFEQVVANAAFADSSFVLALNKKDIFETMIREAPLSRCFPEFKAVEDADHDDATKLRLAIEFIQKQFEDTYHRDSVTPVKRRAIQSHVIAARAIKDVKYMVEDVHKFISARETMPRMSAQRVAQLSAQKQKVSLASARPSSPRRRHSSKPSSSSSTRTSEKKSSSRSSSRRQSSTTSKKKRGKEK